MCTEMLINKHMHIWKVNIFKTGENAYTNNDMEVKDDDLLNKEKTAGY